MSYKILLADDSVTVQKIITLTFSDEGVDVLTVNNGNDAITRLQYMRPALVMADVSIPGRNGYEICEFVKNHPEMKNTPVVLLVPAFETFDEERAVRIGADYHLTKPFQSIRTLIATVKSLIERKEPPANASLQTLPRTGELNSDLINGKSAKIEELIKQSTGSLPPLASVVGDDSPLELPEADLIDPIELESAPAPALALTELEEEVVSTEETTAVIGSDLSTPALQEAGGDDVLELDDVLPELHPLAAAPATTEPLVASESAPGPAALTSAEPAQLSSDVIDEIVARVVAQLSSRLSDELAEKLTERFADGELAHRLAPQVAEILQPQPVSSYRITENLLEID